MIGDERDVHGIDPKFGGLVDSLLSIDEGAVTMELVHRKRRGAYGPQCGDTSGRGQVSPLGTGITCPECRAMPAGKRRHA